MSARTSTTVVDKGEREEAETEVEAHPRGEGSQDGSTQFHNRRDSCATTSHRGDAPGETSADTSIRNQPRRREEIDREEVRGHHRGEETRDVDLDRGTVPRVETPRDPDGIEDQRDRGQERGATPQEGGTTRSAEGLCRQTGNRDHLHRRHARHSWHAHPPRTPRQVMEGGDHRRNRNDQRRAKRTMTGKFLPSPPKEGSNERSQRKGTPKRSRQ